MTIASLRVLGAADTVTGSRYLLTSGGATILVDCGLFQGYKVLRDRNRAPFPVDPASIDAVVLTHAHLDHSGYLPALVRDGYRGPVHATSGTTDLLRILLPDSGRLLEEEADTHRRRGTSRHRPPLPLYTELDALDSLRSLRGHRFDDAFEVLPGVTCRFVPAGHIVGAAQVHLQIDGTAFHFTGDLGRDDDSVMRPPAPLIETDVLITESTYGDRRHPPVDPEAQLADVVNRVAARGGTLVIPAFAVGRAEAIVLHLTRLLAQGAIPSIPMYLNSPMAVDAAAIYERHLAELRISAADIERMKGAVQLVHSVEESIRLNERHGPMVIVSASGMLTGGRVLHHVERFGPDPRNAIALTGFQAAGTRGASLAAGERSLRIFGKDVPINAEVVQLESLSAHADADGLLRWMATAPRAPRLTLVTHGEPHAADTLRLRIERELGWDVRVPSALETFGFEAGRPVGP